MSKTLDCGLTLDEMADSALRVYGHADPGCAVNSDGLSPAARAAWRALVDFIGPVILKLEGAHWSEVAQEVFACWAEGFGSGGCGYTWEELPRIQKLAWEAVARHLTWLFDLDEVLDTGELAATEVRYGAWAQNRLTKERNPE